MSDEDGRERGNRGSVDRGWWADLIAEPTRQQRDRLPRCFSRAGIQRLRHSLDRDGVCVFCDLGKPGFQKAPAMSMKERREWVKQQLF